MTGLNLTVYTASKETGVINTVETIGVSTSKVAELQHERVGEGEGVAGVDDSEVVSLGIICGVALILVCIMTTFAFPLVRRCIRHHDTGGGVTADHGADHDNDPAQAYTVYDKVDLLLPATQQYSTDSSLDTTFSLATGGASTPGTGCLQHKVSTVRMTVSCDSHESITCLQHQEHSNSRESIL